MQATKGQLNRIAQMQGLNKPNKQTERLAKEIAKLDGKKE